MLARQDQCASPLPPQLVGLAAGAERLDVSVKTVRRRIAEGLLPAYRVGRLLKVDPADLDRLARPVPTGGVA